MLKELWAVLRTEPRGDEALESDPHLLAFLSYCLSNRQFSHARNLQDLYVLYTLGGKARGCFVEVGAGDGATHSNSYLLEKSFGWSGIVAEANPLWHEALAANRQCIIECRRVWMRSGEMVPLHGGDAAPASAHAPRPPRVETVALDDLLNSNGIARKFDYLAINTAGNECEILEALDLKRFRPKIITVEHNGVETRREKTRALLGERGYVREFEAIADRDDWYALAGL